MSAEIKSEKTDRDMVKSWANAQLLFRMSLWSIITLWQHMQDWKSPGPVPPLPHLLTQDSHGSDVVVCKTREMAVVRAALETYSVGPIRRAYHFFRILVGVSKHHYFTYVPRQH